MIWSLKQRTNQYGIKSDIVNDIITYKKENEILNIYENNINEEKYPLLKSLIG